MILVFIICCSITAFYIATGEKQAVGAPPPSFAIKEIYQSEPWTFEVENYKISLPAESYIGPAYLEDQLIGIVVQSEGSYLVDINTKRRHSLDNFFLTLNSETYKQIKGDTLFLPLENTVMQRRITAAARPLIRLPEVQGIAYSRIFMPPPETTCIYLEGGKTIPSTHSSVPFNIQPLFLFFDLVGLVVMLTIYLLTMDLDPGNRLKRLYNAKPTLWEKIAAILFLIVILATGIQGKPHTFAVASIHLDTIILYLIIICSLLFMCKKQILSPQGFGLASGLQSYWRGIIIVPVILLIIVLFSTNHIPRFGILANPLDMALQFLLLFGYAFSLEFFWRGFLQTLLERIWGKGVGLLLVTALITLPLFLATYHITGLPLPELAAIEVFFFFPLTALLLGYFYQRSHNLLSVALLHAMVLFLPNIVTL